MRVNPLAALAICTALLLPVLSTPALAATFRYDVSVVDSFDAVTGVVGRPTYDLPIQGTRGTIDVTLDETAFGADDAVPPPGTDLTGLLDVSASIGRLTAALEPAAAAITGIPGGLLFTNGFAAPIDVSIRTSVTDASLSGFFSVLAPAKGAPTTLTDVLGILAHPNAVALFSFNGTVNGGRDSVGLVAVSRPADPVPIVPLPAGGVLLLTALGALAAVRRRTA